MFDVIIRISATVAVSPDSWKSRTFRVLLDTRDDCSIIKSPIMAASTWSFNCFDLAIWHTTVFKVRKSWHLKSLRVKMGFKCDIVPARISRSWKPAEIRKL